MNVNEFAQIGPEAVLAPARAAWTTPSVTRLYAGAAEAMSGSSINDSALERIGS